MYIKILNEKECHYGFQYKQGLNSCRDYIKRIKCKNGFHFTDTDHWMEWIEYGTHFRQVTDVKDLESFRDKYKCSAFILGPRRELMSTEALALAVVRKSGCAIQYLENPSEALKLAAVKQNGRAIQYIRGPSEAVQLAAVQQDEDAIRDIENPSERVQMAVLEKNVYAIEFIKNPSDRIALIAVLQDVYSIKFIRDPSEQVQLTAVL
jgi:hypothetical protein